jgi:hypothetical protein
LRRTGNVKSCPADAGATVEFLADKRQIAGRG